ncbi:type I-E CRISPR-associated protein Cas5/CasD [Nitrospirillum sp. BR 11828]|uniref:type I-E CRISPR-associated protein Cas5/CasD n=1 Tax=Nitrospirillum sp. BR 11828 TaxID=3104325 RepID=UPI002ACAB009|nr:type I-E CRISPR-associated protein Cas5/CasD [Nitrospirillum sp. BR 11828]MDZ5649988.1 type I-E CRISPR-associated protein Cas5/CasD [Nitrospirillum sp. BR 11828]
MASRDFLIFRLQGPMAAWGAVAVGERRPVWDLPSKSAVLGLVAAALGLTRQDTAGHAALEAGLGFAVRQDAAGRPLRDYHTAQAPKARRNAQWRTRREELAGPKDEVNTVLSERLYRLEAAATVALWHRGDTAPALPALAAALARPRYTLYLGRKSCPLGRPPRPRTLAAEGLLAAFSAYDAAEGAAGLKLPSWLTRVRPPADAARDVWFEWDAGLDAEEARVLAGDEDGEHRQRRDAVDDRARWHFTDRREGRLSWRAPIVGEGDAA